MIPYFQYNYFNIGPLTIQVWGIFVSLGLLTAVYFAYRMARKYMLSAEVILDMAIWALVGGLIVARVFHVVFYQLGFYIQYPIEILKFWQGGASSLGGFMGAGLAVWLFAKKRKFKLKEFLPYADISALSLWLGWAIGRLGCFMIHDHPGQLSNFFLAVNMPGGARHDLGLYDSLLALVLFISYLLLFKFLVKIHCGLVAVCSFIDYAIVRFLLDFLRVDASTHGGDIRYAHLTPAQWGMLV
ncbi:MAG: prolipoprotein diacylglyceryl transferase family protein, partial [bacterium]